MMNKYIKIKMMPTGVGIGGAFTTTASFKLDNIQAPFQNIPVKIDTGCSISTVPLAKFKTLGTLCNDLKASDINNGAFYVASYGVETGGNVHTKPITYDEKMNCSALKFQHAVSDFEIAGVPISSQHIFINYDRKGNILIGMDIMKDWDIHIGTIGSGETILLACPQKQLNDEYFLELETIFGISCIVNPACPRQKDAHIPEDDILLP